MSGRVLAAITAAATVATGFVIVVSYLRSVDRWPFPVFALLFGAFLLISIGVFVYALREGE